MKNKNDGLDSMKDEVGDTKQEFRISRFLMLYFPYANVIQRVIENMKILKTIMEWFGLGLERSSEEISKEPEIEEEPHINIRLHKRAWCYKGEKSDPCLSISLASKPEDRFLLVEDIEPHFWSIHFCTTSKDALNEEEKNILIRAISGRIPGGDYLGTHGFITRGGIHGLDRFLDYGFTRTGEKREIIDKETGKILVIDILQKL